MIFYIILLPLYWREVCLSVMLHYNALHSTIAGLGQPSWPAAHSQPDPPQAQAWPGACHLRSTFSRGTTYYIPYTENSFSWFSCFTFCPIIKKGHPLLLCCPWLGSVCRCVWYPCRESRYKWRTLLRSGAFHPFYAKFLSWESPGVSVHRRLVLATEVTVILCYPWLNPDLDSCPSQCRRRSDKMAPAVDTLVAMTDAFEGIDRLAEGAPKTDGAPNFRRVSILYLRICRD